jgi:hypothetical protein
MRTYNNAGTLTSEAADDGTNNADYLEKVTSGDETIIYAIDRENPRVRGSEVKDWGDDLDLVKPDNVSVGDKADYITGKAVYGDTPHLWIFKEDRPYEFVNDTPYEFRSSQMGNMPDYRNGKSAIQFDRYLFFSFHESLERWDENGDLWHMGPDKIGPEGFPEERRGYFNDLVGWGGLLIGAYNAGIDGYSSVLAWNKQGWCELFRSWIPGAEIRHLAIETTRGDKRYTRLIWQCGDTVFYMPLKNSVRDSASDNSSHYDFFSYRPCWQIITGWYYMNFRSAEKFFAKIRMDLDALQVNTYLYAWFQIDDEGNDWQYLGEFKNGSDLEEEFSASYDKYGTKVRFAYTCRETKIKNISRVYSYTVDYNTRVVPKKRLTIRFRAMDNELDLLNEYDSIANADDKLGYIENFGADPRPAYLRYCYPRYDQKYYFVETDSMRQLKRLRDEESGSEGWVCEATLLEA